MGNGMDCGSGGRGRARVFDGGRPFRWTMWYDDFNPTTDDEVRRLLSQPDFASFRPGRKEVRHVPVQRP
jgi:hypothetical protein